MNNFRPMTDDEMGAISKSENAQRAAVNAGNETAEQAYKRNATAVILSMGALKKQLRLHAEVAADNPDNWGFVGDVAEVSRMLANAELMLDPDTEED